MKFLSKSKLSLIPTLQSGNAYNKINRENGDSILLLLLLITSSSKLGVKYSIFTF